jgi:hypothetical protein
MYIQIAGITFFIHVDSSPKLKPPTSLYMPFVAPNNRYFSTDVTVNISLNTFPDITGFVEMFKSGDSWTLFKNNNIYYVVLHAHEHSGKPHWIAEFNSQINHVIVHVGKPFIDKEESNDISVVNPVCFPLDQILVMYVLSKRKGMIVHSAGINTNGKGYIFSGKSGAGKSTLSRQFIGKNKHEIYTDDRMIVRKIKDSFQMFGTPWPGDAQIAENKSAKLHGMFFLSQSSVNRIEEIRPQEAAERLIPVVSIPWYDKEVVPHMLDFCDELVSSIPAYVLHFKPGSEIVDVFEKFVSN